MKKFYICLIVLFVFTSMLTAQMSREDLEETLKYFPAGICGTITHVDDSALADSKLFNKYRGAFRQKHFDPRLDVLPLSMQKGVISRTRADRTRLYKLSEKQMEIVTKSNYDYFTVVKLTNKGAKGEFSGAIYESKEIDGKRVPAGVISVVSTQYRVYRFENLQENISEALKNGELTIEAKAIDDRPVYQLRFKGPLGKEHLAFAYPTLTDELLVAKRFENLQLMVDAGNNTVESLLSQADYKELLLDLNDHMTENWFLWVTNSSSRLRHQLLLENSGDPEIIVNYAKSLECGLTYQFTSNSFSGKHIIYEQFFACNGPVQEAYKNKIKDEEGKSRESEYVKIRIDKEHNILAITKTYDTEFLENKLKKITNNDN